MASLFVKHTVADYGAWKAVFDEHETVRKQYGFSGHSVHRDPQNANIVIVALRVSDLGRAREFAASDSLREVMMRAGVQGMPEQWFGEDLEEKSYS
jgi:hypothetical protein